jgi:uracil phosphoribosyltransferase
MPATLIGQFHVVRHPIAQVCLAQLRSINTDTEGFRRAMQRLGGILFIEASAGLSTTVTEVQTPLAVAPGVRLSRPVVLVPILRAGLGIIDGVLDFAPSAIVAHLGICRDEVTAQPQRYYSKLPETLGQADIFLLDPMLATGGSAVEAVNQLKEAGATSIRLVCVVSCPEGIEAFHGAHPDVPLWTAAIDQGLNAQSFILPGLGDAGDRYFGT